MNKGEATRRKIVEKAAVLFNERGFAGCSMQDIMAATGLEKGGLYRHFKSKEELAAEAFRFALTASVKTRTEDLQASGAIGKLQEIIERFVTTPSAVPGGCPLMNTAIDADDSNPALRDLALGGFTAWRRRICSIVTNGKHSGEIGPEVKPMWLANTIIATLEGALMISRLEGSNEALRDAQASLAVIISSVATKPDRSRLDEGRASTLPVEPAHLSQQE